MGMNLASLAVSQGVLTHDLSRLRSASQWLPFASAYGASKAKVAYHAGLIQRQQGDPRAALRTLRQAAEENPEDPMIRFAVGDVLLELGDVTAAIEAWRAIGDEDFFVQAGKSALDHQQWEWAKQYFLTAQEINPDAEGLRRGLALTYWHSRDWDNAEDAIHQWIRLDGEKAESLYFLGRVAFERHDDLTALDVLHRAFTRDPEGDWGYNSAMALGDVYRSRRQFEEARQWVVIAHEIKPDEETPFIMLAENLADQQQYAQALEQLRAILERNPGSAEAHLRRGRIWLQMGNPEEAVMELELAVQLRSPPASWVYMTLGQAYLAAGDPCAARDAFSHVLALEPDHREAIQQLQDVTCDLSPSDH
jgi:tetratricopeptide (TPR) repeat protein